MKPVSPANSPNSTVQRFCYHATDARGKAVKGEIDAQSIALAKVLLYKQGMTNIRIKPAPKAMFHLQKPIATTDIVLTLRTLSTLIGAGIVLTQALAIASTTTTNARLKAYLDKLKADIETGHSFAQALAKQPPIFGALTQALIHAGEQSGSLDVMLERVASHSEKQLWLKSRINKALHYPLTVLVVAVAVMAILLIKVVPSFASSFASIGAQLPLPTQIVLGLSEFLVAYFWLMLGGILAIIAIMVWRYKTSPSTQKQLATLSLRLPIFGSLIRLSASARFARTLATTFGAGVALNDALALSAKATNHPLFIQATDDVIAKVRAGGSLYTAISHVGLFSPMSLQMIGVGEESGRLVEMLDKVADYHEQQVDAKVDTLTGMIEPVMIVVLGLMIGGLVLAMYLPMFNLGATL